MTFMKIARLIIVIFSFLVVACGVKAPPLPPFKEGISKKEPEKKKKEKDSRSRGSDVEEKSAY